MTLGSLLLVIALVLSACSATASPGALFPPSMSGNGYGYGPGGIGGGAMMGGGVPGGYGYRQFPPAVQPTPSGSASAQADRKIQITAMNFRFEPSEIAINPGETVRFVVTNKDAVLHNFGSQAARISYVPLPAGTTQTVTWTAPDRVGTYTADCTLHPGMDLTITIHEQPPR